MKSISPEFFERSPVVCAREMIGSFLVWDGCEGRVVETEAYAAEGDPACHLFTRPSARVFAESATAGAAYVYLNYGIHWLFNIFVKGPEGAGFVLVRALEPVRGLELMVERRGRSRQEDLCSGPGKLCQALGIDGSAHGCGFLRSSSRGLVQGGNRGVAATGRVGISSAKELPWRFIEPKNRFLSRVTPP